MVARWSGVFFSASQAHYQPSKPALVVATFSPVLRGKPGRNAGDNGDTTRHLSGRSIRALASGLAFGIQQAG